MSIAFARPLAVVDGNVLRVVTRLTADDADPGTTEVRLRAREFVQNSSYTYHPGWVNQAWMELGALICRPVPDCLKHAQGGVHVGCPRLRSANRSPQHRAAGTLRVGSEWTMSLEVFWGSGSPYAWRVLLALEHKGIAYESRLLSFSAREHKPARFLAINPRGQVPAIRDGDYCLHESALVLRQPGQGMLEYWQVGCLISGKLSRA